MSENYTGLPSLPLRLSAMQVLGFKDPDEGDWARLHALQYRELRQTGRARVLAHLIGAAMVVLLFHATTLLPLLAAWLCALAFAVANVVRVESGMGSSITGA